MKKKKNERKWRSGEREERKKRRMLEREREWKNRQC